VFERSEARHERAFKTLFPPSHRTWRETRSSRSRSLAHATLAPDACLPRRTRTLTRAALAPDVRAAPPARTKKPHLK